MTFSQNSTELGFTKDPYWTATPTALEHDLLKKIVRINGKQAHNEVQKFALAPMHILFFLCSRIAKNTTYEVWYFLLERREKLSAWRKCFPFFLTYNLYSSTRKVFISSF